MHPQYDPTLAGKKMEAQVVQKIGGAAVTLETIVITPWGYLEGIEIRFADPLPNMDASRPHHFVIGQLPPLAKVYGIVRNVG